MNKLNVLTYGYLPWGRPGNWIKNIGQFFRNVKYAYQRVTRGFCDWDTWELDHYYSELFYQSLSYLADHHYGYPGVGEFDTDEKWTKYLKNMAELFRTCSMEASDRYPDKFDRYLEFSDSEKAAWFQLENKVWEDQIKDKDQAFDMLKKSFYDLWD